MITKKVKQMITGDSRILENMDEDEGMSMAEWFEAFRFKLPTLTIDEFKDCWGHASLRINSQYSWDTFRQRVADTCAEKTPPFFFLALLGSDDPSEFFVCISLYYSFIVA